MDFRLCEPTRRAKTTSHIHRKYSIKGVIGNRRAGTNVLWPEIFHLGYIFYKGRSIPNPVQPTDEPHNGISIL